MTNYFVIICLILPLFKGSLSGHTNSNSSSAEKNDKMSKSPVGLSECMIQISKFAKAEESLEKCEKKLKYSYAELEKENPDFGTVNFDDKCLGQCILEDMGLLEKNGNFNLMKMKSNVESGLLNIPELKKFAEPLTKAILECVNSKGLKDHEKDPCKSSAFLMNCVDKAEQLICK